LSSLKSGFSAPDKDEGGWIKDKKNRAGFYPSAFILYPFFDAR